MKDLCHQSYSKCEGNAARVRVKVNATRVTVSAKVNAARVSAKVKCRQSYRSEGTCR